MELNRNHYFLIGLIFLLLGVQLRLVDSFLLNEHSSRFIAEKFEGKKPASQTQPLAALMTIQMPIQRKKIVPPRWLGWSLISVGAVLILHSLAMKKPE